LLLAQENRLRASHLRVEERLEKAHRADKYSEGLQRCLRAAHEIIGVRGGISTGQAIPTRTLAMQVIPGWSKKFRREARGPGNLQFEFRISELIGRWAFFNSLLLAILYLGGATGFAASSPFDEASAAYERGDYALGLKLFRELAEQGHQWAQRRLGSIYAGGHGVPQDYQEAVKWYRLAAAQGNVPAQYSLGLAYEKGQGVPQDYHEAMKWYRLAAAREDEWAQMKLGSIYAEGHGVPQDHQEAVKWYRLAAAQGYAPAHYSLGLAYEKGQGVPQDYYEAVKWYRLAATQRNQLAQIRLGEIYSNGKGVRQDLVRAHAWFTLAAAVSGSDSGGTATKKRDRIATKMTAEQIAAAAEMARRCQESKLKDCD
jgi:TPR repeat protein